MWSSVQRIHIGFLESFVWSSMNWNWLFSIVISLKKRFVRFHYMKTYTIRIKQYEINIIDLKRGLSVPLWKGHCHPCMQCHTWNLVTRIRAYIISLFLFCGKLFEFLIMGDYGFQHKVAQSVVFLFLFFFVKNY